VINHTASDPHDELMAAGVIGTLTATTRMPGWLPIPVPSDTERADAWVGERSRELRAAWGSGWAPVHDRLVPALLRAALERRRPSDTLAFQVWPTAGPLCIYVHAAVGSFPAGTRMPGPGDGILYEAEGLGPGVQLPVVEDVGEVRGLGVQFVFADSDIAVSIDVEPTLPEVIAILMPQVHAFVQSLRLTGPRGAAFRAAPPALLEADAADSWIDSLTAT